MTALRAGEAGWPAQPLKVFGASLLIRENSLELREGCGEAADIHKPSLPLKVDFGNQPDKHV